MRALQSKKTRQLFAPVLLLVLAAGGLTARGWAGENKGQAGNGASSVSIPAIICPTAGCPKNCPYHSKPPVRVTIPRPRPTSYEYDAPGRIIRRLTPTDPTPVPMVPLIPTPGPTSIAAAGPTGGRSLAA